MDSKAPAEEEFKLDELPLELLFRIVGFLNRNDVISMMRVSRKFGEISRDQRFWKKLEVDVLKHPVGYAEMLLRHCPNLQELIFCSEDSIFLPNERARIPQELIRPFADCEVLEKLDLGDLKPDDQMVEFVVSSFPNLKDLRLNRARDLSPAGITNLMKLESLEKLDLHVHACNSSNQCKDARVLQIIAENFKNLQELGIGVDIGEDNHVAFINLIKSHADKLKRLRIRGIGEQVVLVFNELVNCQSLQEAELSEFIDDSCLASLRAVGSLKKLELKGEHSCYSPEGLIKFFNESASLQTLETLEFFETDQLSDAGVTAMAKKCTNLRHLCLIYCYNLTEDCISSIMDYCKNLESLQLYRMMIYVTELEDIPTRLPNLRKLNVQCPLLEKDCVRVLRHLQKSAPALEIITSKIVWDIDYGFTGVYRDRTESEEASDYEYVRDGPGPASEGEESDYHDSDSDFY